MKIFKITAVISSVFLGTMASAATQVFNETVATPINAYSSFSGSFDLNSFVAAQQAGGYDVTINSATFSLFGNSRANNTHTSRRSGSFTYYTTQRYTVRIPYSCGGIFSPRTCYRTETRTRQVPSRGNIYTERSGDFEGDYVNARVTGNYLSDDTAAPLVTSTNFQRTTRTYYQYGRSYGSVFDSTSLNAAGMADLLSDLILPYFGSVTRGTFDTLGLRLSVDFDRTPSLSAVPLPASAMLLGSAVFGMGFMRRRKKVAR